MELRKILFKDGAGGEVHKSANHGSIMAKSLVSSDKTQLTFDAQLRVVRVQTLGNSTEGLLEYLVPLEALSMLYPAPPVKLKAAK